KKKRERIISIEQLQVVCGNSMIPTATVSLKVKDEVKTETATGNGPVDAAYTAVKKIFAENNIRLQEFLIQGFNGGCDDSGRVSVQVECNKHFYQGLGVDTDIVTASVEAFVDAISKALE
ncbi:MAG: 2-isopropylmalate synthase, partial [Bacteroidales bacterium]|nr:2-isopropylmalate synthase [Bacteroidales bacterium]